MYLLKYYFFTCFVYCLATTPAVNVFFNRRQLRTTPQYGWTPQYYGQFCSLKYSKLYLHSLPDYLYCNNEHLHDMDTTLLRTMGSRIQYFAHSLPLL